MNKVKNLLVRLLRCIMTPLRYTSVRRNGQVSLSEKVELSNERFLAVVSEVLEQGHSAVIGVRGYSMRPFLENARDKVKLVYSEKVKVGDVVLAQITPGRYVLHRIIHKEGNLLTLQGDGNVRGVENCRVDDVCGVVVEYIRPGRVLKSSDSVLRMEIQIWRVLRPIRRFLLVFYKATLPE